MEKKNVKLCLDLIGGEVDRQIEKLEASRLAARFSGSDSKAMLIFQQEKDACNKTIEDLLKIAEIIEQAYDDEQERVEA